MARNYKRLGGIINASAGPAKARAVFAESFGILRKKVVNLRKNPVSSPIRCSNKDLLIANVPVEECLLGVRLEQVESVLSRYRYE